jgi:purine-binding chemotaxis protein CheW
MSTPSAIRSYITFKLGEELFAIDVAHAREVLDLSEITRVPTAPPYMRGVVNVRGSAIPVVDLRLKFGLPATPDTVNTRILVLELELDGELSIVVGLGKKADQFIIVLDIARVFASEEALLATEQPQLEAAVS